MRKNKHIEKVNEAREKAREGIEKHWILEKENPNSTTIDEPPINIPSRKVVVDENTMIDLLGDDYCMYEVREEIGALPPYEEVPVAQYLVRESNISKNSHEHVQSPPTILTP